MIKLLRSKYGLDNAEIILLCCSLALFIILCLWNVYYLPMDMDEALIYHRLACSSHPFSYFHSLREDCLEAHTLTDMFGFKLYRPSAYIGPVQNFAFTPFYYLFPSMQTQYWFAVPFFLLFAWLMARETAKPLRSWIIITTFFPMALQFIHDDGILKVIAVTFPLSMMLTRKALDATGGKQVLYVALLAFIVLFNIVDKVYFLYLFPSFVFFSLAATGDKNWKELFGKVRRVLPAVIGVGVVSGALLLIHLLSVNNKGEVYLTWLFSMLSEKQSFLDLFKLFIGFIFFWPSFAHRVVSLSYDSLPFFFFMFLSAAWFAGGLYFVRERLKDGGERLSLRTILLLLSLLSVALVFIICRNVNSAHHFIFLWIPGLMLVADLVCKLSKQEFVVIAAGFFALNLLTIFYATLAPIQDIQSRERYAIFEYLDKSVPAEKALVNFSSWGGYYIYSLYSPKDILVTYVDNLEKSNTDKLLEISKASGRKLYNVCFGPTCNEFFLGVAFDNRLKFTNLMPELRAWKVFVGEPLNK